MDKQNEQTLQEELREQPFNPEIIEQQGLLSKVLKAGLVTALVAGSVSKFKKGNSNVAKLLNNKYAKFAITSGVMMATSPDDNTSADVGSAGVFLALGMGVGQGRKMLQSGDINQYKKVYGFFKGAEEVYKNLSFASINLKYQAKKTFMTSLTNSFQEAFSTNNAETGTLGKSINLATAIGKGFVKTIGEGIGTVIDNFSQHGFTGGAKETFKNLNNTDIYQEYLSSTYRNKNLNNILNGTEHIKFKTSAPKGLEDEAKLGFFGEIKRMFTSPFSTGMSDEEEKIKVFRKFQNVENNTLFADMTGRYTELKDGKVVAKVGNIFKDDANFSDVLNELANHYKTITPTDIRSEEGFVEYLNKQGFSYITENLYKNDKHISYGEISEMLENKEELPKDIYDYLYSGGSIKHLKVSANKKTLSGLENTDILANFSFTNVIEKTSNGMFTDKTALNQDILKWQVLSVVEKNMSAFYKTPLTKKLSHWNPASLLETKGRIKNIVKNDILQADSKNGVTIVQGRLFKPFIIGLDQVEDKPIIPILAAGYNKTEKSSYKMDYRSKVHELFDERLSIKKDNVQSKYYVYNSKTSWGKRLEKLTYSQYNPFLIRYDSGPKKWRWVQSHEVNQKESSLIEDALNLATRKEFGIDTSDIKADNKRFKKENLEKIDKYLGQIYYRMFDSNKDQFLLNFDYLKKQSANDIRDFLNEKYKLMEDGTEKEFTKKMYNGFLGMIKDLTTAKTDEDITKAWAKFGDISGELEKAYGLKADEKLLGQLNEQFLSQKFRIEQYKEAFNKLGKDDKDSFKKLMSSFFKDYKKSDGTTSTFAENTKAMFDILEQRGLDYDGRSIRNAQNHLRDTLQAEKRARTIAYNYVAKQMQLDDNYLKDYFNEVDVASDGNAFNTLYEHILNFEYNTLNNNSFEAGDYKTFNKWKELINSDEEIAKYHRVGTTRQSQNKNINLLNFEEKYKKVHFYTSTDNGKDTATIIYDRLEGAMETKKLLDKIKEFIFGSSREKYKPEAIWMRHQVRAGTVYSLEHNHFEKNMYGYPVTTDWDIKDNIEITSNTIVSKFSDALETIGVQRLLLSKENQKGINPVIEMFKKRVIPLMALTAGAIAANSFTDAAIPDSVPIIGNGALGVATRAYSAARVGLQYGLKYTGALGILRGIENMAPGVIDNGFLDPFDLLMDPEEMTDVYFRGKPITVKKNRFWFTAGRQASQGEEFDQYRPNLLYIWGNPSSGIYDNKVTKFFRRDFLPSKYAWYLLDPYKEEREAYKKFGLLHPKTEQLFKDIPVIGHLMSATVGEAIKPTQYILEDQWKVEDGLMKNPNYNPYDENSPEFIKYTEPNRMLEALFEGIEDLKTWSGLPGFALTKGTELIFNKTNPYQDTIALSSLDQDINYYNSYDRLQLGGMFGMTEPIRRIIDDDNGLGSINMNPMKQAVPDFFPEYFKNTQNAFSKLDYAEYLLPNQAFEDMSINDGINNNELKKMRTLAMLAPTSPAFENIRNQLYRNMDMLNPKEKTYFYSSVGLAEKYNKRDFVKNSNFYKDLEEIEVGIKRKLTPNEFIGMDNKRYKLDTLNNFNDLEMALGSSKATNIYETVNNHFKEGEVYKFKVSNNPTISVGTDKKGDFIKLDSEFISSNWIVKDTSYRDRNNGILGTFFGTAAKLATAPFRSGPSPMNMAKFFGKDTALHKWSNESVQSPYFRDWDTPYSSFVEPFYTFSSNSLSSYIKFTNQSTQTFLDSGQTDFDFLGNLALVGLAKAPFNKITGNVTTSRQYQTETEIQDEVEQIKYLSGKKSFYNFSGNENLKTLSNMLNESDSVYFEELVNTTSDSERKQILEVANPRMQEILKTIWARQANYLKGKKRFKREQQPIQMPNIENIHMFNQDFRTTGNLLKMHKGIALSKLDNKRMAVINSYRGSKAQKQAAFINNDINNTYNQNGVVSSTISPIGNINLTVSRGRFY